MTVQWARGGPDLLVALDRDAGSLGSQVQEQLRAASAEAFPDKASFVGLKTGGSLTSPDDAAARIIAFLARPDFGANPVADVRDPA